AGGGRPILDGRLLRDAHDRLPPGRYLLRLETAYGLGGATRIEKAAGHVLVGIDGAAELDDDIVVDGRPVEDHDAVADGDVAADRAGVHAGVAAHGHPVADNAGKDLVIDVQGGTRAQVKVVA